MNMQKVMKTVIMIAVICIPIIYSFFYLKAYWDPYGNLDDIKIALVNLDEGENGENQGEKLVDSLVEKDIVDIVKLNDEEFAKNGLVNREYYATITIPKDFTKTLNNAENKDRAKAVITYSPNQKTNYLASQIINKIVTSTETKLRGEVSKKVVEKLSDNIKEVPSSLKEINDGATKIQDGTESLQAGLGELKDGTSTLVNKYSEFNDGVSTVNSGANAVKQGVQSISSGASALRVGSADLDDALKLLNSGVEYLAYQGQSGITEISGGINRLKTSSTNLSNNLSAYVTKVDEYNKNTTDLLEKIVAYGNSNPTLLATDQNFAKLYGTAKAIVSTGSKDALKTNGALIAAGGNDLVQGVSLFETKLSDVSSLVQGVDKLKTSVESINKGAEKLNAGTINLDAGVNTLNEGVASLSNGTNTLAAGSLQIKDALDILNKGTKSAYDGSVTLNEGVKTFKTEIEKGINDANSQIEKLDGLADYAENPVEIVEEDYGEISSYGVSFTPLFLSIGLWVGILMLFVILYYDQENRFKLLGRYAENKSLRMVLFAVIAIAQGLVTGVLLKLGLGLEVTNNFLYYASCILSAITFLSIIQFLILTFGDIGKFLSLIILVLQLAASGGTFPVETIAKGFRVLTPYLTMTYTIRLLKESVILQDSGFAKENILVLLGIIVVFFALTIVIEKIKEKKEKSTKVKA